MSGIIYEVHKCDLPNFDGLGIGSVFKCDCGKLYELYEFPYIRGYHMPSVPAETCWIPLASQWFDEATQTPVPRGERFILTPPVIYPPTGWQRLRNKWTEEKNK